MAVSLKDYYACMAEISLWETKLAIINVFVYMLLHSFQPSQLLRLSLKLGLWKLLLAVHAAIPIVAIGYYFIIFVIFI